MSNSYEQFGAAMREAAEYARAALAALDRALGALQETLEAAWEAITGFMETVLDIIHDTAAGIVWMWRLKQKVRRNRQYALTLSKSGRLEKRKRLSPKDHIRRALGIRSPSGRF